ncbi:MAG: hypothetical protein PHP77_09540, partial [Bacteroidales bacterium]|nr:hypothetical protein [Bacteroidales bacterium]
NEYLNVAKQNKNHMLPSKSNKFFSEISDLLTSSEKGITRIIKLYRKLDLHKIKIGHQDYPQASYRRCDLLLCLYTAEAVAKFKGYSVKFFFCKNSRKGKWHVLVTTNTRIGVVKAYRTYSISWSIEVFFKEAKRFDSYETLGILFRQAGQQVTELTIYNRIWQFILDLLRLLAELIDGDFNELVFNVIKQQPEDNRLLKLMEKQKLRKLVA